MPDGRPGREVLEGGSPDRDRRGGRRRSSWLAALPTWGRVGVAALAALVVLVAGASAVADWWSERRARDRVALEATLRVSSSSSSPVGGRVDYYVEVRNVGPRPVRLSAVSADWSGMAISNRSRLGDAVPAGGDRLVALSVRLDCAVRSAGRSADRPASRSAGDPSARPAQSGERVREVAVVATPWSGRRRTERVRVGQAYLLTDAADVLCRLRPGLRGRELSGPVLQRAP